MLIRTGTLHYHQGAGNEAGQSRSTQSMQDLLWSLRPVSRYVMRWSRYNTQYAIRPHMCVPSMRFSLLVLAVWIAHRVLMYSTSAAKLTCVHYRRCVYQFRSNTNRVS